MQEVCKTLSPDHRGPRQVDELLQDEQEPGRDPKGKHFQTHSKRVQKDETLCRVRPPERHSQEKRPQDHVREPGKHRDHAHRRDVPALQNLPHRRGDPGHGLGRVPVRAADHDAHPGAAGLHPSICAGLPGRVQRGRPDDQAARAPELEPAHQSHARRGQAAEQGHQRVGLHAGDRRAVHQQ